MKNLEPSYLPGDLVPDSGIYECDCQGRHAWSADVAGDRFPPLPEGCDGSFWKLAEERPTIELIHDADSIPRKGSRLT